MLAHGIQLNIRKHDHLFRARSEGLAQDLFEILFVSAVNMIIGSHHSIRGFQQSFPFGVVSNIS